MAQQLSSISSRGRLAWLGLASACAASGCQVDERDLSMTSAGAMSGGAAGSVASGGSAGSGSLTAGGDHAAADSPTEGSLGGTLGAGGSLAGSGGVGGSALGGDAGHADGVAGAAHDPGGGAAGSSDAGAQLPCGDIDQDRIDDCSETLAQNSRFDANLDYWVAEALSIRSWDARNASSGTGSGSVLISNLAPVASASGSFMAGAHQCLQVVGGTSYGLAARALIPGGQGAGEAGINLQIFGVDGCAGSFLKAETVASSSEVDTWSVLQGEALMPSTARSVWVRLVVSKPFSQATLDALFDDVLVRQE